MSQNSILAVVGGLATSVLLGGFLPAAVAHGRPADVAAAETVHCARVDSTILVTKHSPRVMHGTIHRDVIVIRHSVHLVKSHDGNDLICGSGGHGRHHIDGGPGKDACHGGGGHDIVQEGHHGAGHHGDHLHSLLKAPC
jgi:hypothetical protein